jgi:hypothetical protein
MERKVKYNYEFKLRCVYEVLDNNRSVFLLKFFKLNIWLYELHIFDMNFDSF